jgi:hypothetical protein
VQPDNLMRESLLGMSFLSKVSLFEISGGRLVLRIRAIQRSVYDLPAHIQEYLVITLKRVAADAEPTA